MVCHNKHQLSLFHLFAKSFGIACALFAVSSFQISTGTFVVGSVVAAQEKESSDAKESVSFQGKRILIQLSESETQRLDAASQNMPLADLIRVRLLNSDSNLLGQFEFDSKRRVISFLPRFPLDPETKLKILIGPPEAPIIEHDYQIPGKTNSPKPTVAAIYPTSNKLPANVLKFYLHFSAPMQKGNIYRHFSIVDSQTGKQVELPFLELEQELWSRDGLRLTLFFDPGRIKRGLKPREELGPVFEHERNYEFRIAGKWKSDVGVPLGKDVVKKFRVIEEDNQTPQLEKWALKLPPSGSREPLIVSFDESLDSALLRRVLRIEYQGKSIELKMLTLSDNEKKASFVPTQPWQSGEYILKIGPELEDLAGNRIGKPFDVELSERTQKTNLPAFEIPFRIKPN